MKARLLLSLPSVLLLTGALITSCNKDSSLILNNDLQTIQDDALINAADEDINTFADQFEGSGDAMMMKSGSTVVVDTCPLVTHFMSGDTNKITIDFGTDCIDRNLNSRSGKIIITKVGRMIDQGYYRMVTLENFIVNGNKIEGTREVKNLGLTDGGNIHFSVTLTGGKITTQDGDVLEYTFNRDREWIAGSETLTPWDNEYLVTGSATGVNFKGENYTCTIIEPLHINRACRFIESGIVETVVGESTPVTLDYGDGTCDNIAILSKDGESKNIELRMRRHRWVNR